MGNLLESTVPWPPDMSWTVEGRSFHDLYGDNANCLEGEHLSEVPLAQFVAAGHYPQVQAELIKRGLV